MVTGGPQHDYTHTEGGAVVCNYCNLLLRAAEEIDRLGSMS